MMDSIATAFATGLIGAAVTGIGALGIIRTELKYHRRDLDIIAQKVERLEARET